MSTNRAKRNQVERHHDDDEGDEDSPKRLRGGGGYGDDGDDDDVDLPYDDDGDLDVLAGMDEPHDDDYDDDVAFGDITDAHRNRWSRPAVPDSVWRTDENDLNLQWLDIDTIGGKPLGTNPNKSKKVIGSNVGTVPIIRLYGVNETGNSVAVFIHGFTSYAYFALPRGYGMDGSDENLGKVRAVLDEILRSKLGSEFSGGTKGGGNGGGGDEHQQQPRACLGVQSVTDKSSIMGYDPSHTAFLKVYVAMPNMINKLKTIMEEGIRLPGLRNNANSSDYEVRESVIYQPFECNVPYVMRYMIDKDITGASWLTLPRGTYRLRRSEGEKGTHCQVSYTVCSPLSVLLVNDMHAPRYISPLSLLNDPV
jgi:DNA polymerase delta subunit 1